MGRCRHCDGSVITNASHQTQNKKGEREFLERAQGNWCAVSAPKQPRRDELAPGPAWDSQNLGRPQFLQPRHFAHREFIYPLCQSFSKYLPGAFYVPAVKCLWAPGASTGKATNNGKR